MVFSEVWMWHQLVGAIFVCTFIVAYHLPRTGKLLGALWLWVLGNAAWVAFSPYYSPSYLPATFEVRTVWGASQALVMAVALPLVAMRMRLYHYAWLVYSWGVVEQILRFAGITGTVNGDTFGSAALLLAALIPVSLPALPLLFVPGILWFYGSTTVTMLVTAIAVRVPWKRPWYRTAGFGIICSIIGAVLLREGWEALYSNSRAEVWVAGIRFWSNRAPWYGTGIGTWEWIGTYLRNDAGQAFLWAHNDFVQMLVEGGAPGFWLLLAVTCNTLWRLRSRPRWLSLAGAYVMCMLTYYPLHFTITQLIGLLILRTAHTTLRPGDVSARSDERVVR